MASTYNSGSFILNSGPFIKKWDLLLQNSRPFLCEDGSSEPTEPPLATGLRLYMQRQSVHYHTYSYDLNSCIICLVNIYDYKHAYTNIILGGGKFGEFGKSWAILQNFPHQYSDMCTLKMYLVLTVAYSPNFSSPIAFTYTVRQIVPRQIFPMYSS